MRLSFYIYTIKEHLFVFLSPRAESDPKMRLADVVLILNHKYLNLILTVLGT